MTSQLPVLAHADAIRSAVRDHRRLILSAPPGTGKSTQVPQILMPAEGTAFILQPRSIAARSLAARVAAERGEAVGASVGFQVRFERSRAASTRLMFATYGVFWQKLVQDPHLRARHDFVHAHHADHGDFEQVGWVLAGMERDQPEPQLRDSSVTDTDQLLADVGYSAPELADLRRKGTIS